MQSSLRFGLRHWTGPTRPVKACLVRDLVRPQTGPERPLWADWGRSWRTRWTASTASDKRYRQSIGKPCSVDIILSPERTLMTKPLISLFLRVCVNSHNLMFMLTCVYVVYDWKFCLCFVLYTIILKSYDLWISDKFCLASEDYEF